MKFFRVVKPGFFTTVQDLGRHGFLKYGVPVSGAMDDFSLALANMLVGNKVGDACLEITLIGPELEVLNDTQIAFAGADFAPRVNGEEVEMWQTLVVREADLVSFGKPQNGCRAYLAVRGGINAPTVLKSRSTYVRCEMGGVQGRQLKAEDVVEGFNEANHLNYKLSLPEKFIPKFTEEAQVHVVLGPQLESFTAKGVETFLSNPYVVTFESDRMGYRLEGPSVEQKTHNTGISDAILPGAVQVPPDGKPIIMMKDAQTTGGYPKIAVVVTSDLCVLGQAKPRDTVYFRKVTLLEAQQRLLAYIKRLQTVEKEMRRQAA